MRGRFVLICLCLGMLIAPTVLADEWIEVYMNPSEEVPLPPGLELIIREDSGDTEYRQGEEGPWNSIEGEIHLIGDPPIILRPEGTGSSRIYYKEIK